MMPFLKYLALLNAVKPGPTIEAQGTLVPFPTSGFELPIQQGGREGAVFS